LSPTRIAYRQLPASVRRRVGEVVGPVTAAESSTEGLNSSVAARLRTPAGHCFLKALPVEHRWSGTQAREAEIAPHLAPVAALLSRISELSGAATPLRLAEQRLAAHTTKDLLHHFAGESLLRTDLNPANILVNAGQARIVDWSWATRGTAWLDAAYWVSWLIAAGHTPNQAESWAAQVPAWHTAPPKAITAFAEANAKIWAESSAPSPDPWTSKIVTASKSWSQHRR